MIYTFTTKNEQLKHGFFRTGTGSEQVLIVGSCRAMPYLNYLARWNETANSMTIHYINPFDWGWNAREEQVDVEQAIDGLEQDPRILDVLKKTTVFIHEHYGNYGMFNTSRDSAKNIYQFGMASEKDISVPNFHDHFILHDDFKAFGELPPDWVARGEAAVEKFCALCLLSSFPEMAEHFRSNWRSTRFFWTPNHISAPFSMYLFRQMNERFLHLPLDDTFWQQAASEDMFSTPCTAVTQHDRDAYRLTWT